MTYQEIRNNEEVCALLEKGNQNLGVLGFTDHSEAHCLLVAERAAYILRKLGYSDHEEELVRIAGFMHDIGNAINRTHHAELGALLANDILKQTDMPMADRIAVIAAGYADSYPRGLSNKGAYAVINGVKCPQIGHICMDMCMFDVTDADVRRGDEAILYGRGGMPPEEVAALTGSINCEIPSLLTNRVKKIYL